MTARTDHLDPNQFPYSRDAVGDGLDRVTAVLAREAQLVDDQCQGDRHCKNCPVHDRALQTRLRRPQDGGSSRPTSTAGAAWGSNKTDILAPPHIAPGSAIASYRRNLTAERGTRDFCCAACHTRRSR